MGLSGWALDGIWASEGRRFPLRQCVQHGLAIDKGFVGHVRRPETAPDRAGEFVASIPRCALGCSRAAQAPHPPIAGHVDRQGR
jgi:hypothetical protein